MQLRVIDLDGSISAQAALIDRFSPEILDFSHWGPRLRITCGFGAFRRFQQQFEEKTAIHDPRLTFLGSGDFHHATLALLRQLTEPFNLLVIDKHPDWMRAIPVMHCGTWLWHALRLPTLKRVFHIGGDLDFDNLYRWLAPWPDLRSGRVKVIPAYRHYRRGGWNELAHRPLMRAGDPAAMAEVLEEALRDDRNDLSSRPLYISLDKDVMCAEEAAVNWDSGTLGFQEVRDVLDWFHEASGGHLAGMDVVGDWSPVRLRPGLRTFCHWTEHPALAINPEAATGINQAMNLAIADHVNEWELQAAAGGNWVKR
jgi:arginase family enzyme